MKKIFFTRVGEIKNVYKVSHLKVLHMFKESYLTFDDTNASLSSVIISLLSEFEDMFPKEMFIGLPAIRGIKYYINFVLRVSYPIEQSIEVIPMRLKSFKGKLWS